MWIVAFIHLGRRKMLDRVVAALILAADVTLPPCGEAVACDADGQTQIP